MEAEPVPAKRGRPRKAEGSSVSTSTRKASTTATTATSTTARSKTRSARQVSTTTQATTQGTSRKVASASVTKGAKAKASSTAKGTKTASAKKAKGAGVEEPVATIAPGAASMAKGASKTTSAGASMAPPRHESKILQEVAAKEAQNMTGKSASQQPIADDTAAVPLPVRRTPVAAVPPSMPRFSPEVAANLSAAKGKPAAAAEAPPSIKQINAYAVNSISARAHPGRPDPKISTGNVATRYKPFARRITTLMVAVPIVAVTSYALYDRLVLGNDRKLLLKPAPPKVVED